MTGTVFWYNTFEGIWIRAEQIHDNLPVHGMYSFSFYTVSRKLQQDCQDLVDLHLPSEKPDSFGVLTVQSFRETLAGERASVTRWPEMFQGPSSITKEKMGDLMEDEERAARRTGGL